MGKFSDFFSMSKQERVGAWMIALLIAVLLVAMFIEKKCTSDDINTTSPSEMSDYIEKAEKTKPKEKKKEKKEISKKNKNSKKDNKKNEKKNKSTKKQEKKAKPKQEKSKSNGNSQRTLEPMPQF